MGKYFGEIFIFFITAFNSFAYAEGNGGEESFLKLFIKMILYLLIFIAVIVLCFYGTKLVGKRSKSFFKSKYMEIIDTVSLGTNIKLIIMKVNDKIYIMGVGNNGFTLIDKINEDEFPIHEESDEKNFTDYLKKYNSILALKDLGKIKDKLKMKRSNEVNSNECRDEKDDKKNS